VTLLANVKPGGSQAAVITKMNQFAKETNIDPAYSTGLAGRSKELGRAGYYFMLAFVLSFVFMYMVLAAQFESFIHPVTILLTLPLAIPFGIVSLLITGQTVNIFSGWDYCFFLALSRKTRFCKSTTRTVARTRHGTPGSNHSREPRSFAANFDDYDRAGRGHVCR